MRDPAKRANVAVLSCLAFAKPKPLERQTWRIRLSASGVQAICEFPRQRVGFNRADLAGDPRIAGLRWERKTEELPAGVLLIHRRRLTRAGSRG